MNSQIQELHSLFKTCLDILRNDAEHLIGDESLNELSYFLILKQAEKHIENKTIDIYNLEYYKEGINDYGDKKFLEYLEYIKFSKFVEYVKIPEKEDNIKNIFDKFLWKEVLSKHPKFNKVFEDGKRSFIKESITIKKIIIVLSSIDFNNYDYDILGEAYESIFVDAVFGAGGNKKSELGQFFTPSKVKKLLVNLVNPKLKDNGEIESVLDPAAGTGGILNTIIKHFKQFEKSKQITSEKLRNQLIKNIYGIEIKGKIYNLCLSNMLINTGEILPNVKCADSIRTFHNIKVDNIVANPPFSVTINYDELLTSLGGVETLYDYIPIKTGGKNSEILFLQMMIYCLNINGKCATVMLDGQKMYGSSSGYNKVREYLMKSCDLQEVILCPSGTFTSTASKTCILFFTKKKERKDVVNIIGTKRTLEFCKSHSTKSVKFYEFNPDTEIKYFIKEVDIIEISKNNYSLNYNEYDIEEEENKNKDGLIYKELSEVCNIIKGEKKRSKNGKDNGLYPLYYCSILGNLYLDTFDYTGEGIIINKTNGSGKAMVYYGSNKYNVGESTIHFKSKINELKTKYIYYYLFHNIELLQKYYKGANQKSIVEKDLFKIKIPIPSIEKQNKIVEFLNNIYNKVNILDTLKYYSHINIFNLLLNQEFQIYNSLIIAQLFNIKINNINEIQDINEDLNNLYKIKENILIKLNSKYII
jgi:type I restriction-modification system DNA methylase subunit